MRKEFAPQFQSEEGEEVDNRADDYIWVCEINIKRIDRTGDLGSKAPKHYPGTLRDET